MNEVPIEYLKELKDILDDFPDDVFDRIVKALLRANEDGKQIFVMGNGGSGATASHFACDINKGVSNGFAKRFRVICVNDSIPTMLAYANDMAYEDVFVEQIKNFFQAGDIVLAFSGSGNSKNVLKATIFANENGGTTIGLCGFNGGALARIVHIPLVVNSNDMQKVEDVHLIVVHMLMQSLHRFLRVPPLPGS